jgi:hypothetical protein
MNNSEFKRLSVRVALTIFALAASRGEAQVLTLIPTQVESNKAMAISADADGRPVGLIALSLKTATLPAGVAVAKVVLVLNIENQGTAAQQTINVYLQKPGTCTVPAIFKDLQSRAFPVDNEVHQGTGSSCTYTLSRLEANASIDLRAKTAKWRADATDWKKLGVSLNDGFTLILAGTGGPRPMGRKFLGITAETKLRPRLIVEYTSSDQAAVAQPAYVQSGKSFLPSGSSQGSYKSLALNMGQGAIWSYSPAFSNGFVYLISDVGGKKYLSWQRPLGAIVDQIDISSRSPGPHLLVSRSGYLYIVGDGKIIPYRIGANGRPEVRKVSPEGAPPTDDVPVTGLNEARDAPTLGANGSMFYVESSAVKGYAVAGRNPDLQELWSTPVAGPASRAMLGPSGRYVYVTTKGEGLVTIDARTGEKFVNELPNSKDLKVAKSEYLQTPVVFTESNGTEKVYVAADTVNEGYLTLFNNNKTKNADDKGTIEPGWKDGPAVFGQPLVTAGRVYVVRVDSAAKNSAHVEYFDPSSGQKTRAKEPLTIATDSPYLPRGGNLAADTDGNVFVWNGNAALGDLKAFNSSLDLLFTENIAGQLEPASNLFFATDGTLFAAKQKSALRAIVPYYSLTGVTSRIAITSPTHVWVAGSMSNGKANTLTGTETVILGSGFEVRSGAELAVHVSK